MFLQDSKSGAQQPNYTSLPIQTSVSTLPIPILWGTGMLAGNLIWYSDFKKSGGSGGKGLGSSKSGGPDYSAAIQLALCEGPVTFIKSATDGHSWQTLSQAGLTLIPGNMPSSAWSYISTKYPSDALTYPGVALLVSSDYNMGSSPQIPSNQVVLQGQLAGSASWASSGEFQNADLGLVIQDALTNPRYGARDFPASAINTATLLSSSAATTTGDMTLQTYCRSNGWGYSILLSSEETFLSVLQRWLQVANCDSVWSGGALKFIPYGDTQISANGVTYLPNQTALYSLDDDDFVSSNDEDPVQVTRIDPSDIANIIRVEVVNNDGYYESYPCEARDQAGIEAVGVRADSSVQAHEILSPTQGLALASLLLARKRAVRNTYTFKLNFTKCLLEPMDLVEITDLNLGLSAYPVRIVSIEEDSQGVLTVTAEDFPGTISGPVLYASQVVTSYINNQANTADPVNPPVFFEPPYNVTGGAMQIWFALSGGSGGLADPFWGGAEIYLSSDNVNYTLDGEVVAPARQGVLTATLAAYSGTSPDNTNALTVNLAESDGVLISATTLDASQAETLSYVDGELISYTTATLLTGNTYALTGLYRGLGGTVAGAHGVGTQFARLDDAVYIYPLPSKWVGKVIYAKFVSFNIWGQGYQNIADCTAYSYTPGGVAAVIAGPITTDMSFYAILQTGVMAYNEMQIYWPEVLTGSGVYSSPPGSYLVQYSSNGGVSWTTLSVLSNHIPFSQNNVIVPLVQPETNYQARVQAISSNGLAISPFVYTPVRNSGPALDHVPTATTGFTIAAAGGGQVNYNSGSPNSTDVTSGFQIWRAAGSSQPFSAASILETVIAPTGTSGYITHVTTGAATFFLTWYNAAGTGAPTAGINLTVT